MNKKISFLILGFVVSLTIHAQIITSFPWNENFDELVQGTGQQIPPDWTSENLDEDFSIWDVLPNSTSYPENAHSAPNAIHMSFSFDGPVNDWLYTPPLMFTANTAYTLKFWYKHVDFAGTVEKMKIHVGNLPTSTEMSLLPIWDNSNITNEEYEADSVVFTPTEDGIFHFGFNSYSDAEQFLLVVDDVSVSDESNTSLKPVVILSETSIFPNPSNGSVWIRSKQNKTSIFRIFDVSGQLLSEFQIKGELNKINLNDFPKGIYLYSMTDSDKNQSKGKITLY